MSVFRGIGKAAPKHVIVEDFPPFAHVAMQRTTRRRPRNEAYKP